jgi:hypothetical protein
MSTLSKEQRLIARLANSLQTLVSSIKKNAENESEAQEFLDPHQNLVNEALYSLNHLSPDTPKPTGKPTSAVVHDHEHLFDIGRQVGMDELCDIMAEAVKTYNITGLKLGHTIVSALAAERKISTMTRNIRHAVGAGMDIDSGGLGIKVLDGVFSLVITD